MVKRFFVIALTLLLLPWGAWLRAAEAAPRHPTSPALSAPVQIRVAPEPVRRCGTAKAPASVCQLELAPDEVELPLPPGAEGQALTADRTVTPTEWAGPVLVPPPRLN